MMAHVPDDIRTGETRVITAKARAWRFWILFAAFVGVIGFLIGTSESFQRCIQDRKTHHAYDALHEENPLLIKLIVRLNLHAACARYTAGENDGAITALATFLIAGFTFTLWRATPGMLEASERQHKDTLRSIRAAEEMAKAAANALPRPWVIVEGFRHTTKQWAAGQGRMAIFFRMKNYGSGPAFIGSFSASGFIRVVDGQDVPEPPSILDIGRLPTELEVDLDILPHERPIAQSYTVSTGSRTGGILLSRSMNAPIHLASGEARDDLFIVISDRLTASELPSETFAGYLTSYLRYRPCFIGVIDYKDVYDRPFRTRIAMEGGAEGILSEVGGSALNMRT
jgi:hypothetical protein